MIYICGKTEDGKLVVGGVFKFFNTEGVPLDVVFEVLKSKNAIPDWILLAKEALDSGMSINRVLSILDVAISDSYGVEIRDKVIETFKKINNKIEIKIKFEELAKQWRKETILSSNPNFITSNDNYIKIIEIGFCIVPYILKDIKDNRNIMWIDALIKITKNNPVPSFETRSIELAKYWVDWGEKQGLI